MLFVVWDKKKQAYGSLEVKPDGGIRKMMLDIKSVLGYYRPAYRYDD